MQNRIVHFIPNTSMVYGHDRLDAIARSAGHKPEAMSPGEFIMFTNKAFNAVKMLAANNVVVHYKHPKKHPLNYRALQIVPLFFSGGDMKYPQALRKVIEKEYPKLAEKKARHDQ